MKTKFQQSISRMERSVNHFINKTLFSSTPRAKQFIRNYLERDHELLSWEIYNIKVRRVFSDKYTITITTGKPGILIGRKGRFIQGLQKYLEKNLGSKAFIKVKDFSVWDTTFNQKYIESLIDNDQDDYIDSLLDEEFDRLVEKERE